MRRSSQPLETEGAGDGWPLWGLARSLQRQKLELELQAQLLDELWRELGPELEPGVESMPLSVLARYSATVTGGKFEKGQFPETCAVISKNQAPATGIVLHKNLVLTAGHAPFGTDRRVLFPIDVLVEETAGDDRFHHVIGEPLIHPSPIADLAVVHVQREAALPFPPAKLGNAGHFQAALETGGTMVGYGRESFASDDYIGYKRSSARPVKPASETGPDVDSEISFVVPTIRHGLCIGDSGGPFYLRNGDDRILLGVAAQSIDPAPCGRENVYTRVDRFADWIRHTAAGLGINLP